MPSALVALRFDAADPSRLAAFWSVVLGRAIAPGDPAVLLPDDDHGFLLRFVPRPDPVTGVDRMHLDLTSSSPEDQARQVQIVLGLGATHLDVGQTGAEGHVVLADPEGNEFCIIEAGNGFLVGCGRLGALPGDGLRATGVFWSRALGWPLVWDQDEETAIQAPRGGTKITWGGPPVAPKRGRNRRRLELAPTAGDDLDSELARLVDLGARRIAEDQDGVLLADPDDNEFHLCR